MAALLWIANNWKVIALMALIGGLLAVGVRIRYLENQLATSRQRENELEGYKHGREAYDEVDAVLGDDVDIAREYLRKRKGSKAGGVLRRNGPRQ